MTADYLALLDWRRRVADLFADLRKRPPTDATAAWFRAEKDELFRTHPQSPLLPSERASFAGLPYWEFEPSARVKAQFVPDQDAPPVHAETAASGPGSFFRIGRLEFDFPGYGPTSLGAYWIRGYAGGLFVPFRDATSAIGETYGAGRYLLDTIKSADHGGEWNMSTVVLDFNYAYHPSCAYDPSWLCPLAPPENTLPFPVRFGERLASDPHGGRTAFWHAPR